MEQEKFLDFVDWKKDETEEEHLANYLMQWMTTGYIMLISSISGEGELRH
jgi:hypothetical protein